MSFFTELDNEYNEPGQQWMNTISLIMNDILDSVRQFHSFYFVFPLFCFSDQDFIF